MWKVGVSGTSRVEDMKESGGRRAYRIGIDVGGTFTKAVLVDHVSRDVVGRYSVLTTHDHTRGVAAGVVDVFEKVLERSGVSPDEIVFLAHSTTQATNALLEGDVAPVGIVGIAGEAAAKLAKAQVRIDPIELAPGRFLPTRNRFLVAEAADEAAVARVVDELAGEGADVLVASAAFGVDNTSSEEAVREAGQRAGLLATCGHEITRLYGLQTRTRTAVINASILPKMNATATMTETAVREAGIKAPVMIMRGDGGVMDIAEMRRRPAMTMLSGPAASVAGALMHLRVTDGIYFEVGGTSTNVGVIRNGRPTVAYAHVGGHETYVNSLDVRVLGIAGGSLIRARDGDLVDVGPRSAHIAGLAYAAFADVDAIRSPRLVTVRPRAGDSDEYVAIETADGKRFALTATCAANAAGYVMPGMHAHGNVDAARIAFDCLGKALGCDGVTAARKVLACAAEKVIPVVEGLARHYHLEHEDLKLVGEGGGAGALVPFVAEAMGLDYEISRDAEVISSIGAALALVRDVVERVIPHPQPEDLKAIREEAIAAVVRLGAQPDTVDVAIDVNTTTGRVRATAIGSAELNVRDEAGAISEVEARAIASQSLHVPAGELSLRARVGGFRVYSDGEEGAARLRVIDWTGLIRLQRRAALVQQTTVGAMARDLEAMLKEASVDGGNAGIVLMYGRHLVDLTGLDDVKQALAVASSEVADLSGEAQLILLASVGA